MTIVGGFSAALALARASDLIASVPERHTGNLRAGMHSFPLPVSMPEIQFHCSGIRGWMPTRRIAGCAIAFGTLARGNSRPHRHAASFRFPCKRHKPEDISKGGRSGGFCCQVPPNPA